MRSRKGKERTFGSELRRLRRSHPDNVTLAHTAKEIGCTVSMMSAIENGHRNPPSPLAIRKLMVYLNVPERSEDMIRLATEFRGTVEFKLEPQRDAVKEMLLTLKRKSDDNTLTSDEVEQIRLILKGRESE